VWIEGARYDALPSFEDALQHFPDIIVGFFDISNVPDNELDTLKFGE